MPGSAETTAAAAQQPHQADRRVPRLRRLRHLRRLARSPGATTCSPGSAPAITARWTTCRESIETRLDPGQLQPGCRSVIVVAWLYRVRETAERPARRGPDSAPRPPAVDAADPAHLGRIARYAWGRDYHRVMRTRLYRLVDQLRAELPGPFKTRVCVDIWPVLERELAERAGIGWIGSNCLVLSRTLGSYFCLGTVLTTLDLAPDAARGRRLRHVPPLRRTPARPAPCSNRARWTPAAA